MLRFFKKINGKNVICFDLEGPLSPMDLAFELIKLIPRGDKIFPVISRYDDLLTLETKEDYQPGDTLKLIIPFLIRGRITERDIESVSVGAALIEGAMELVKMLKKEGWKIYINSTSYRQHALVIAKRLGIKESNVFSTEFLLDKFQRDLRGERLHWVELAETYISNFLFSENLSSGEKDREIREYLDTFYWPLVGKIGEIIAKVKVNGGERKVESLRQICLREKIGLEDIVVVGDSITDSKMLRTVKNAGGLAIAFNANKYALPCALVGTVGISIKDIKPILDAWQKKTRGALRDLIMRNSGKYQWIGEKDIARLREEGVLKIHEEFRRLVRGKMTARLG